MSHDESSPFHQYAGCVADISIFPGFQKSTFLNRQPPSCLRFRPGCGFHYRKCDLGNRVPHSQLEVRLGCGSSPNRHSECLQPGSPRRIALVAFSASKSLSPERSSPLSIFLVPLMFGISQRLKHFGVTPDAADIFGRTRLFPLQAERVLLAFFDRQVTFEHNLMLPAITEIVLVLEVKFACCLSARCH